MQDINRSHLQAAARRLDAVLTDERLTDTEKIVLLKLMSTDTARFKITRQGIATMLHHNIKTIEKAFARLRELGYLRTVSQRDHRGRWETAYFVFDAFQELGNDAEQAIAPIFSADQCEEFPQEPAQGATEPPTLEAMAAPCACSPTTISPTPKIWVHNSTSITAATTAREEGPTTTGTTATEQAAPAPMEPPTLEEVTAFAQDIHAKSDPQRYWLLRSASGWHTKTGRTVTAWRLDFQLWNLNERNTAPAADAQAPAQQPCYTYARRKAPYSDFQQRDPYALNIDDICLPL